MKRNKPYLILSALGLSLSLAACGTPTASSVSQSEPVSEASSILPSIESEPAKQDIVITGAASMGAGYTQTLQANVSGVSWASSDDKIATVDNAGLVTAIAGGKVTITATLEGYNAGTIEITVVAGVKIDPAKAGLLIGSFAGSNSALSINEEGAFYSPFEGDEDSDLVLTPTSVTTEELRGTTGDGWVTETLTCINFAKEVNDGIEYRVHLSVGNIKKLVFEKLGENGRYETIDRLMPLTSEFSGAFNMYEPNSVDPKNYVYLFDSVYNSAIGGYAIDYMHAYSEEIHSTGWVLETCFAYNASDELVTSFMVYDPYDGEYFDGVYYNAEDNISVIGEEADYDFYYPDFSVLTQNLYDDKGNRVKFYFDEGKLLNEDFESLGSPKPRHDDGGWYTDFVTEESTITLRFAKDDLYITKGENDITYYAPTFSFLDFYNAYIEWGDGYDFRGGDVKLEFGISMDEDWNETPSVKLNGVEADEGSILVKAGYDGKAFLTFKHNGKVGEFYQVSGKKVGNLFREDSVDPVLLFNHSLMVSDFAKDFYGATSDGAVRIEVDESFNVSFNGSPFESEFTFYEGSGAVGLAFDGKTLLPLNEDPGVYALVEDEKPEEAAAILFDLDFFSSFQGTYSAYNFDSYVFGGEDGTTLTQGENTLSYETTAISTSTGELMPAIRVSSTNYLFALDIRGLINVYSYTNAGLALSATLIHNARFLGVPGDYIYLGKSGEEHLKIEADGKLYLDTFTDATKTALESVNYDYHFAFDNDSRLQIIVHIPSGVSFQFVTLTFNGIGFEIPNSDITYVHDYLIPAQGIYFGGGHAFLIKGNSLTVDGMLMSPTWSVDEDGNTVIDYSTWKDGEHKIVFGEDNLGAKTITFDGETPLEEIADFDIADYVGSWTVGEDKYELKLDETTGVYTMYKNDAFFMSNYKLVDYDGHFAVLFETPFGKAYLYEDNSEIVCVALPSTL